MKRLVPPRRYAARLLLICGLALAGGSGMTTKAATLPEGFVEEPVGGVWEEACGLTFDSTGRIYVWERRGRIWMVENGVRLPEPLIDLTEEVGGWRDFGMLGFALDPQFRQNGHIYLLYVVDRHHLKYFGTPTYNPNANEYFQATIGRLTRYTARAEDDFRSVDPASRRVLIGESIHTGFPILHQSHGTGSLVFGADGTLLASAGDGASYTGVDAGGVAGENYAAQALADGIIQPKEDLGAYRAQMVDSLSGKIVRIDPATGDGVPGNPFYDPGQPRLARSRVWALGLRNPYRMTLRPGTGSSNRADGKPGVLYIGDVGWSTWEELNVATGPGKNFGWPVYEGMDVQSEYFGYVVHNWDATNPLYGINGCTREYFNFRDLLHVDTLGPLSFPNPCDRSQQIPDYIPRFVHTRPVIEWRESARIPTYDGRGQATIARLGDPASPVAGSQFTGKCSVGGVWYAGSDFPAEYRGTYFHADFEAGWIQNLRFDGNDRLLSVRSFATNAGAIVALGTDPVRGGLYYIRWGMEVLKISYLSDSNRPPVAIALADRTHGMSPLTVRFTGSRSSDPEGAPLAFRWDFGDGSPAAISADPAHTFRSPPGVSTNFTVRLTVTDSSNASASTTLVISLNNTPPLVRITSPIDGTRYPMTGDTTYQLRASVSDAQSPESALAYQWQTILHHNEHQHSEAIDTNHVSQTVISPIGCDGQTYYFRIRLVVRDPQGLSATNEVSLYPDCGGGSRPPFPSPWLHQDIGAVTAAGEASYSNGVFTVIGNGADIWGREDAFHYVYWPQKGDGQIIARVAAQDHTDPWAKAGVMIRENLAADAKYAMAAVAPSGLLFQSRSATAGESSARMMFGTNAPFWIKLVRTGNQFTASASPDGANWNLIESAVVTMAGNAFGGFAVTSHKAGVLGRAVFDHIVALDSSPPAPRLSWMPRERPDQLRLKVQGQPGERYRLEASLDLDHWHMVATLENATGVVFFTESRPQEQRQRFFRLVVLP